MSAGSSETEKAALAVAVELAKESYGDLAKPALSEVGKALGIIAKLLS